MSRMVKGVLLLASEKRLVRYDMPLPCRLPDDQPVSQVTPGKDNCCLHSIEPQNETTLSLPVSKHCCRYPREM